MWPNNNSFMTANADTIITQIQKQTEHNETETEIDTRASKNLFLKKGSTITCSK